MAWYVVFQGRVPGVYESSAICNDQVLGYAGSSFLSYATRTGAEAAYVTFLDHNKKKKA
jgi:ribonuclease HI